MLCPDIGCRIIMTTYYQDFAHNGIIVILRKTDFCFHFIENDV